MVYCNECGKKNDDDTQYCTKCGNYIAKGNAFEKNIETAAEEFGRKAERFGKRIEKKAKEFAKSVEQKSDSNAMCCRGCETELNNDAKFCWKCGNKIE